MKKETFLVTLAVNRIIVVSGPSYDPRLPDKGFGSKPHSFLVEAASPQELDKKIEEKVEEVASQYRSWGKMYKNAGDVTIAGITKISNGVYLRALFSRMKQWFFQSASSNNHLRR